MYTSKTQVYHSDKKGIRELRKKYRKIIVILLFCLCVGMMAGCGKNTKTNQPKLSISLGSLGYEISDSGLSCFSAGNGSIAGQLNSSLSTEEETGAGEAYGQDIDEDEKKENPSRADEEKLGDSDEAEYEVNSPEEASTEEAVADTVAANGELFTETDGKYDYCPSVITDGNIYNVWFCSNMDAYEVRDVIDYIHITDNGDGTYSYSGRTTVLKPGSGWDSEHVCDPSVITGDFYYQGQHYCYLMAYLGCSTTNNQKNEIGLAVSNSMDSGWVKCDSVNPIIHSGYDSSHVEFQWGAGQPSLISLDNGRVMLFYTSGTYNLTSEKAEIWDLSNIDSPVCEGSTTVGSAGLAQTDGAADFISNADFVFNGDTLYMVCDRHPYNQGVLSVANQTRIAKAVVGSLSLENIANAVWTDISYISDSDRNHNAGFCRNSMGTSYSCVMYTSAFDTDDFAASLYTYRLKIY